MKCPKDDVTLLMSSRAGIEIDYCPECRGVWLDRGELDKILERAESELASARPAAAAPAAPAPAAPEPAGWSGQAAPFGLPGGNTDLIDVGDLGLDRFDAEGRSRLASDSVALPYPTVVGD